MHITHLLQPVAQRYQLERCVLSKRFAQAPKRDCHSAMSYEGCDPIIHSMEQPQACGLLCTFQQASTKQQKKHEKGFLACYSTRIETL